MKKELLIKVLQTLPEDVTNVIIVHRDREHKKDFVVSRDFAISDRVKLKSDEYTEDYAALWIDSEESCHIRGVEVDELRFYMGQEDTKQ